MVKVCSNLLHLGKEENPMKALGEAHWALAEVHYYWLNWIIAVILTNMYKNDVSSLQPKPHLKINLKVKFKGKHRDFSGGPVTKNSGSLSLILAGRMQKPRFDPWPRNWPYRAQLKILHATMKIEDPVKLQPRLGTVKYINKLNIYKKRRLYKASLPSP